MLLAHLAALPGLPSPGFRRSHGTPGKHDHVLLTVDDTLVLAEHWVLEDSSKVAQCCSAGRRAAAKEECFAAVQKAASRDGLEVAGFKIVNDGADGVVPAGCSYSLHTMTAMFNTNAAGGNGGGNYRLACLALPDEAPTIESTSSEARTSRPSDKRSTVLFLHVHNNNNVSSSQHQQIVDSWAYKQGLQVRFVVPESCVPPKGARGLRGSSSLSSETAPAEDNVKTNENDLPTEAMLNTLRATPQFQQVSRPGDSS